MIRAISSRYLTIPKNEMQHAKIIKLKKMLTIDNPAYKQSKLMTGKPNPNISQKIHAYIEEDDYIHIPRHFNETQEFKELELELDITYRKEYVDNHIDLKWKETISLRDYQVEPVARLLTSGHILHADPGAGKTTMAINIMSNLKLKTAVVVDSDMLADQWRDRLLHYTDLQDEEIGILGDNKNKDGKVVICYIQSLLRRTYNGNKDFYNAFPLVIIDECHSTGSSEFFKVLNRFPGRRIGLTATINRTDRLKTYIWSIGTTFVRAEVTMLIPDVHFLPTKTSLDYKLAYYRNMNTVILGRLLVKDKERNNRILAFAQKRVNDGRHIIVLTHSRENAQFFFDNLICDRKALLIGKGNKASKQQRRDHDDPQLICATFQFLYKGFDNAKMDTILFVTPFNAENVVIQSTGRIRRFLDGKPTPIIYDIYDPMTTISLETARNRQRTYKRLGFNIVKSVKDTYQ